jgi:hypothetical protein
MERKFRHDSPIAGRIERTGAKRGLVVAVVPDVPSLGVQLIVPRGPIGSGSVRFRRDEDGGPSQSIDCPDFRDRVDAMVQLNPTRI